MPTFCASARNVVIFPPKTLTMLPRRTRRYSRAITLGFAARPTSGRTAAKVEAMAVGAVLQRGDRRLLADGRSFLRRGGDDRAHQRVVVHLRVEKAEAAAQLTRAQRHARQQLFGRPFLVPRNVVPAGQQVVKDQAG